jgi:hypothetical protein
MASINQLAFGLGEPHFVSRQRHPVFRALQVDVAAQAEIASQNAAAAGDDDDYGLQQMAEGDVGAEMGMKDIHHPRPLPAGAG